MSRRDAPKTNMWEGDSDESSLAQVADEIYGTSAGPALDSGRVVARPTPIDEIWADVKQPRRAVPASVRLHWNGDPAQVETLLSEWRRAAVTLTGEPIDAVALIKGEGEGLSIDEYPPLAREFVELCRLAASIRADGLLNPINVAKVGDRNLIVAGERRWLAYHLLSLHMYQDGAKWKRIPAQTISDIDHVWKQAAENTARRQLNAIGMARQLALLIMAARKGEPYQDFDEIVQPGVCDRRYYAQVADGNVHRIPRGMGERIQSSMGLSEKRLSDYRSLLQLTSDEQVNDALWVRADVESWADIALREIRTLPLGKVRELVTGTDDWTLEALRAMAERPEPRIWGDGRPVSAEEEAELERANQAVYTDPRAALANYPPPSSETLPPPLGVGDAVLNAGQPCVVLGVNHGMARVKMPNGSTPLVPIGSLRRLPGPQRTEWPDGVDVGDAVEIIHTGEVGAVERRYTDQGGRRFVYVNVGGASNAYPLLEVRALDVAYEDFIRQELESGDVEFEDGDTEADDDRVSAPVGVPPLQMRPGPLSREQDARPTPLSSYYEQHAQGPAKSADKAVSPTSTDPVLHHALAGYDVLMAARAYALRIEDEETREAVDVLKALTPGKLQAMSARGTYDEQLAPIYEAVVAALVGAIDACFDELDRWR